LTPKVTLLLNLPFMSGRPRYAMPAAKITGYAYDQTAADLYGYKVTINGTTSHTPKVLSDPSVSGSNDELEVRYIAGSNGLTTRSDYGRSGHRLCQRRCYRQHREQHRDSGR